MNCPESILAISAASSHVYKARAVATSNLQFKFSNRMDFCYSTHYTIVVQIDE